MWDSVVKQKVYEHKELEVYLDLDTSTQVASIYVSDLHSNELLRLNVGLPEDQHEEFVERMAQQIVDTLVECQEAYGDIAIIEDQ